MCTYFSWVELHKRFWFIHRILISNEVLTNANFIVLQLNMQKKQNNTLDMAHTTQDTWGATTVEMNQGKYFLIGGNVFYACIPNVNWYCKLFIWETRHERWHATLPLTRRRPLTQTQLDQNCVISCLLL